MPISFGQFTRRIVVGVIVALAAAIGGAQPASPAANRPSASGPKPSLADKAPVWKISPGGPDRMINSVAVSADGGRVIGGTYFHNNGSAVVGGSDDSSIYYFKP